MYLYLPNLNPDLTSQKGDFLQHFITLRVKPQDQIWVSDLAGQKALIQIHSLDKKSFNLEYQILDLQASPRPESKSLWQAQTDKNYLEKLVEILAHTWFTDLIIFRSRYSPKQNLNLPRLEKILHRSCEQAQNPWLPKIQWLPEPDFTTLSAANTLILDQDGEDINNWESNSENLENILVGPEGGFSQEEKKYFQELDFTPLSIGQKVYPAWLAGFVISQKLS